MLLSVDIQMSKGKNVSFLAFFLFLPNKQMKMPAGYIIFKTSKLISTEKNLNSRLELILIFLFFKTASLVL